MTSADGSQTVPGRLIPIPGYIVMMGALDGLIFGHRAAPVTADTLARFTKVWPAEQTAVLVDPGRGHALPT